MNSIKLWTVTRSTEDMKGWTGTYKKETDTWYYTFDQAIETAKQQGLTLPTKQDFLDSWFTEGWTENNKKLADKFWLKKSGYCDSDGNLNYNGEYGFLGSVSEYNKAIARNFKFDKDKGILYWYYKNNRFVCRPLVKNSTSDTSSIWQFSTKELRDELGKRLLSIE